MVPRSTLLGIYDSIVIGQIHFFVTHSCETGQCHVYRVASLRLASHTHVHVLTRRHNRDSPPLSLFLSTLFSIRDGTSSMYWSTIYIVGSVTSFLFKIHFPVDVEKYATPLRAHIGRNRERTTHWETERWLTLVRRRDRPCSNLFTSLYFIHRYLHRVS